MNEKLQNEDVITLLQYIEARKRKVEEIEKQNYEQAVYYRQREKELIPIVNEIIKEYKFTLTI